MIIKVLKWTGLIISVLVTGFVVAVFSRQHLTYEAPYPNIKASTDLAVIERGKHLTLKIKGCAECHSSISNIDSLLENGKEPSFAGARKVETPFGIIFTPNITPDAETGIGSMTDAEIARVLRYGVKSNGEAVLPFMQGQDMSDGDMVAVVSYLRSLKPVENKVPENDFTFLGRVAKAFVIKPSFSDVAVSAVP